MNIYKRIGLYALLLLRRPVQGKPPGSVRHSLQVTAQGTIGDNNAALVVTTGMAIS